MDLSQLGERKIIKIFQKLFLTKMKIYFTHQDLQYHRQKRIKNFHAGDKF